MGSNGKEYNVFPIMAASELLGYRIAGDSGYTDLTYHNTIWGTKATINKFFYCGAIPLISISFHTFSNSTVTINVSPVEIILAEYLK